MFDSVSNDPFVKPVSIPVFLSLYGFKKESSVLDPVKPENLEEDVKIEENYLEYLFHYKNDISHLVN
ncbi:MAG: hypothetical protein OCD02_07495 [Spirochaetaceae bacterium]